MLSFGQDVRLATRALSRRPGFALTALLIIAVAIAANTAIFSVVRGVLLASLPFPDPGRLVTLDVRATTGFLVSTSVPNYRDWGERSRVFQSYGSSAGWAMSLTGRGPAETVGIRVVLGDFFGTLGLTTRVGRVLRPEETLPGAPGQVVLGYGYWRRAMAGDPAVIGQAITLDGRPYVVVGVLDEGKGFPSPDIETYVGLGSVPGLPWEDRRSSFGLRMVARLLPGVGLEEAQLDLGRVGREVRELNGTDTAMPELRSMSDFLVGDVRLQVWLLMGAVAFVLLIAAGNVANLMLARGEDRRQEMAVRTALGAGRGALARQILMESIVLSVAGGLAGVVLARPCIHVLLSILGSSLPAISVSRIRLDAQVLAFAVGVSVATGLFFGLVPALRASRRELVHQLKATRDGLRSLLVVTELALALVLLVGAALMIRSLQQLQAVDKGFDATNVLTARTDIPREKYTTAERWRGFYQQSAEQISSLPGVRGVALSLLLPLSERSWERAIWPEGVPPVHGTGQSVLYNIVSGGYFDALGVKIVRGRPFTDADRDGAVPVTIIDETMAARFWPGQDAVGKRVTFETTGGAHDGEPVYRTVIGVARNVRHYELNNPSRIQVYIPFTQLLMASTPDLAFVVKTSVPPATLIQPLRQVIATVDADVPVSNLQQMQDYVDGSLSGSRALVQLLSAFGATALLLASIGIFGVMSYTVARRTREIGVRMALGATRAEVLQWVAGRALALCGIGVVVGSVVAAGVSRVLTRLLFQVSALDMRVYLEVALVLLAAGLLAALLPARRAASVDPVTALRSD
jgi:predicted permease